MAGDKLRVWYPEIEKKIRARYSYDYWQKLLRFLQRNPNNKTILRKFHEIIDDYHGFKSQTNSNYSKESLELVLKDKT